MAKQPKAKKNELIYDYKMLEKMSSQLSEHQDNIRLIAKKVAKIASKDDRADGIAETLGVVSNYMIKAQREVDKAKERLKLI